MAFLSVGFSFLSGFWLCRGDGDLGLAAAFFAAAFVCFTLRDEK